MTQQRHIGGRAKNGTDGSSAGPGWLDEQLSEVQDEAIRCLAPGRIDDLIEDWIPDARSATDLPPDAALARMTLALAMATTLALFTQSGSGQTAFDRLARQRRVAAPHLPVLDALRRTRFRVIRVEVPHGENAADVRDVASGEVLRIVDEGIMPETAGLRLAVWVVPDNGGGNRFTGPVVPLDDDAFAVVEGFIRPGRSGLVNPLRCAEAVYRHVVRNGPMHVPGFDGEVDALFADDDDLAILAGEWSRADGARDPEDVLFVRAQSDPDTVVGVMIAIVGARSAGRDRLAGAWEEIGRLQIETIDRRARISPSALTLEALDSFVARLMATGEIPSSVRQVFIEMRHVVARPGKDRPADGRADPDALIARIQALRVRTVERGCTEEEALAAAAKVAELLDRHGLSLSELDVRNQACESAIVETTRKRAGPLDDCIPSIAAFFDSRVWGETNERGMLRYVFFGLPADVAAACYLYELVEQAFETEGALFKAGETYRAMPSTLRRTATHSFQHGLAHGIMEKLRILRESRETALRGGASGRDLVVLKAGVVDEEMAALGLRLRARTRSGDRRVLRDVYDHGHQTGLDFDYRPGLGRAG